MPEISRFLGIVIGMFYVIGMFSRGAQRQ